MTNEKKCLDFIKKFSRDKLYFPLPEDIAGDLDVSKSTAQNTLRSLVVSGDVVKMDHYHYRLAENHVKDLKKAKK